MVDEKPQHQHNGSEGIGGKLVITDPANLFVGAPIIPDANEQGLKDTVQALPGQVTRVIATFDRTGRYVWHCHILSHEDHEMMRPYQVGPIPVMDQHSAASIAMSRAGIANLTWKQDRDALATTSTIAATLSHANSIPLHDDKRLKDDRRHHPLAVEWNPRHDVPDRSEPVELWFNNVDRGIDIHGHFTKVLDDALLTLLATEQKSVSNRGR